MTSSAITFDDVRAACGALEAEGKKITILAVRERLGRGSFTTVKKHLEQWREAQPAQQSHAGLPTELGNLWEQARKAARAELDAERETLTQLAADLQLRFQTMEDQVNEANRRRQEAETRLGDRTAELARATALMEALQQDATKSLAQMQEVHARERAILLEGQAKERDTWIALFDSAVLGPLKTLSSDMGKVAELATSSAQLNGKAVFGFETAWRHLESRLERSEREGPIMLAKLEELERMTRQVWHEDHHRLPSHRGGRRRHNQIAKRGDGTGPLAQTRP